ncbi:hypothetical protein Bpfe_029689, partial [Biomphalaria pfeifferi]
KGNKFQLDPGLGVRELTCRPTIFIPHRLTEFISFGVKSITQDGCQVNVTSAASLIRLVTGVSHRG